MWLDRSGYTYQLFPWPADGFGKLFHLFRSSASPFLKCKSRSRKKNTYFQGWSWVSNESDNNSMQVQQGAWPRAYTVTALVTFPIHVYHWSYLMLIPTGLPNSAGGKTTQVLTPRSFPGRNHLQFSSVQWLSRVRLFATPWIAACQASLSITNSRSLLRLMPIESVMPSSHLILCRPRLLLLPIPPSINQPSLSCAVASICHWWNLGWNSVAEENLDAGPSKHLYKDYQAEREAPLVSWNNVCHNTVAQSHLVTESESDF